MKQHERGELLTCARRLAVVLQVAPAAVPVEGYYTESRRLTDYFLLVRALQELDEDHTTAVASLPEFQRLQTVMSAPLFGRPQQNNKLLPVGRDPLLQALLDTSPGWNVQLLMATANTVARETDDFSLVGLAARTGDEVVLAATRESVVLYGEVGFGDSMLPPPPPNYIWRVDADLAKQATRFIDTFNELFSESLPPAAATAAENYWYACEGNEILGRCVRLGFDDTVRPIRQYHWGICCDVSGIPEVREFWHSEVWTTERYRTSLRYNCRCPDM
jgi:hypothetical protein